MCSNCSVEMDGRRNSLIEELLTVGESWGISKDDPGVVLLSIERLRHRVDG
jgi:hypothetical protein